MIVAGVMSGTSTDGINVALVQLSARGRKDPSHELLAHEEYPFPAPVRRAVLAMMNAELASVADLARLNFLLGELYAEAVAKTARKHRVKLDLVGCHGQTLYHQGDAQRFDIGLLGSARIRQLRLQFQRSFPDIKIEKE